MSRLPIIGGDSDQWGTILNDFLAVSLAPDGNIAASLLALVRGANLAITANAITVTKSLHVISSGAGPLKTINGAVSGRTALLILQNASGASVVVDSSNNIYATAAAGSLTLANGQFLMLISDTTNWRTLALSP